ncbi:MAG: biopolymer transporter ExbD [candidate division WOR-3 bacterium]|nr:MAG: biopolymer transporter ExbD [candidate division WOR-3 bacterium]
MILREKKVARAGIPTASMGDVAFLILIFFLTSTVFTKDKGLKMLLPERTEEQEQVKVKPENIVTVAINPAGEVKIKTVDMDKILVAEEYGEIKTIVEDRLFARDTLLVVSLRPSKDAPYDNMIQALDQIKLAKTTSADGRELRVTKISLIPTSEE